MFKSDSLFGSLTLSTSNEQPDTHTYSGTLMGEQTTVTLNADGTATSPVFTLYEYENVRYVKEGNWVTFTVDGWVIAYIEINGTTFVSLDGMHLLSFTASDGNTMLMFDGHGGATLGIHSGTYQLLTSSSFTLSFGNGNEYTIEIVEGNEINVKITIGDESYVFGTPTETTDPQPGGNNLKDYAGETISTPVKYGYNTIDEAGSDVLSFESTLGTVKVYSISFTWYSTKSTPAFCVSVGATRTQDGTVKDISSNNTNLLVKLSGSNVEDHDIANTPVTFTLQGNTVTLSFSTTADGTRQVTITVGQTSVTFAEIVA